MATLYENHVICVDHLNNIYAINGNRIRKIDAVTSTITTIAGDNTNGYNGDGIPATTAQLNSPFGLTSDAEGNIYIGDLANSRIRKINNTNGVITTVAGTGIDGYNGEGVIATLAQLHASKLIMDKKQNIYFLDLFRIRKVSPSTLPVTFISFTVKPLLNYTLLESETANEINSSHFNIQFSYDGMGTNWVSLGKVLSGGRQYSFTDSSLPRSGFYRLQQVDKDGKTTYSIVRSFSPDKNITATVYPNPVQDFFIVELAKQPLRPITFSIINLSGKIVQSGKIIMKKHYINTQSLSAGTYIFKAGSISKILEIVK